MFTCQLFGAFILAVQVYSKNIQIHDNTLDTTRISDTTTPEREETIHCYCNLPECVATGYMCKSHSLGCFSDLVSNLDMDRALHGCLDLLTSERGNECQNVPSQEAPEPIARVTQPHTQASLLLCCKQDMCNHVDSPEARNKYNETLFAAAMLNGSEQEGHHLSSGTVQIGGGSMTPPSYSDQELWFRAATIAVPICGALILLILVLLAMKLLRSDVLEEHRIIQTKLRGKDNGGGGVAVQVLNPELSEKKHPLLYHYNPVMKTDNTNPIVHPQVIVLAGPDKNTKNARLNSNLDLFSTDLFSKSLDLGSCNIYNTTQPLLPPSSREKLVFKKAFVSWPPPPNNQ